MKALPAADGKGWVLNIKHKCRHVQAHYFRSNPTDAQVLLLSRQNCRRCVHDDSRQLQLPFS